jgi:hypothetical protein
MDSQLLIWTLISMGSLLAVILLIAFETSNHSKFIYHVRLMTIQVIWFVCIKHPYLWGFASRNTLRIALKLFESRPLHEGSVIESLHRVLPGPFAFGRYSAELFQMQTSTCPQVSEMMGFLDVTKLPNFVLVSVKTVDGHSGFVVKTTRSLQSSWVDRDGFDVHLVYARREYSNIKPLPSFNIISEMDTKRLNIPGATRSRYSYIEPMLKDILLSFKSSDLFKS